MINPGLELGHGFLRREDGQVPAERLQGESRQRYLRQVTDAEVDRSYIRAFDRRLLDLKSEGSIRLYAAISINRVATGLGAESPIEVGFSFLRPYGVPVLAGSSLKGAMLREAIRTLGLRPLAQKQEARGDEKTDLWTPDAPFKDLVKSLLGMSIPKNAVDLTASELIRESGLDPSGDDAGLLRKLLFVQRAFGSAEGAGAFDVLHAWPFGNKSADRPGFDQRNGFKPLLLDTVTVHHSAYYSGKQPFARPSDVPMPVSCVSIRPGTGFVFGIRAGDEQLHNYVRGILDATLRQGVGAKTAKGYGRFAELKALG